MWPSFCLFPKKSYSPSSGLLAGHFILTLATNTSEIIEIIHCGQEINIII